VLVVQATLGTPEIVGIPVLVVLVAAEELQLVMVGAAVTVVTLLAFATH